MKISASLLAALIDFASSRGIAAPSLYALVDHKDMDWCAPESRVDSKGYLQVLKTILHQDKDPQLGLHFGRYLNLSALGMVHQISLQAKSIEQALVILQTYFTHQFPIVQLSRSTQKERLQLKLHSSIENQLLKDIILDSCLVLIARELELLLPNDSFILTVANIETASYLTLLNHSVQQGNSNAFLINLEALKQGINPRSRQQIEVLLPQYLKMIYQKEQDRSFVGITQQMILHLCAPELPNIKIVCEQLGLSTRSFQRKLREEGSSFRKINLEIKQEISQFLEAGKKIKIQDIAYILGYSEASAYIHARNNWQKT